MVTKRNLHVTDFAVKPLNDNYLQFTATAGYIGKPTRVTPCGGATGYNIILGDGDNVSELVGAGVNCSYDYKKHNKAFKIGVIDCATVEDDAISVEGHLWRTDFPDVCDTIECAKNSLGCSVEVYCNGVDVDDEAKTQTLRDVHFTGMSIVYKDKAAFEGTNFMCSMVEEEGNFVTEKELQAAVAQAVDAKIEKLRAEFAKQIEELKSVKSVEEIKEEPVKTEFSADIVKAAMKEVIEEWAATVDAKSAPSVARKTQQFSSEAQFKSEKSLVELSKEIDDDPNLDENQKWSAQLAVWQDHLKKSA